MRHLEAILFWFGMFLPWIFAILGFGVALRNTHGKAKILIVSTLFIPLLGLIIPRRPEFENLTVVLAWSTFFVYAIFYIFYLLRLAYLKIFKNSKLKEIQ